MAKTETFAQRVGRTGAKGNIVPGGVPGSSQSKGSRRALLALLVGWGILVAYAVSQNKPGLNANQRRAALAAAIVVVLVLSFAGEFAPGLATGFAAILLVSMLLAGPGNGLLVLTKTIPQNLLKGGQ